MHHADHDATFGDLIKRGGFRALEQLRATGEIKAFGLGVNEWQICLEAMEYADIDIVLLAGRYTLLDQSALAKLLPACIKRETSVVIDGVYNSGILPTGTRIGEVFRYNHEPATPSTIAQVQRIEAICDNHRVRLPAAALQFPLVHPAVVSIIPGLDTPAHVAQTLELYREPIPGVFWEEMRGVGSCPLRRLCQLRRDYMMRIDAHQYFWKPQRNDYGWLTQGMPALCREFSPRDLQPLLKIG